MEGISLRGRSETRIVEGSLEDNGTGLLLAERASASLKGTRVVGNRGHGVWARDEARVRVSGGTVADNRDNGLYLTGSAWVELRDTQARGNRCGLACAEASGAQAERTSFAQNAQTNVSLEGGSHRFERCVIEKSPVGFRLSGSAAARMELCDARGHSGEGVSLHGGSRVEMLGCALEDNGTGLGLAERASALLEGARVLGNRGHGVWARGEALARVSGGTVADNRDNGLYLTGSARVELRDAQVSGNRCGLACAEASRVRVERTSFARNARINVSLEGGRHRFRDVSLESSPVGAAVHGSARGGFSRSRITGHDHGVRLSGTAVAGFLYGVWSDNGVGLWAQENSLCGVRGGVFSRQKEHGARVSQQASLRAAGTRLRGCFIAVFLQDRGSARIERCVFRGNPTGVKADDESRLDLRRSRLSGCAVDGVWLNGRTRAALTGNLFSRNRIGVHQHEDARPDCGENVFARNELGDHRRFSGEAAGAVPAPARAPRQTGAGGMSGEPMGFPGTARG